MPKDRGGKEESKEALHLCIETAKDSLWPLRCWRGGLGNLKSMFPYWLLSYSCSVIAQFNSLLVHAHSASAPQAQSSQKNAPTTLKPEPSLWAT